MIMVESMNTLLLVLTLAQIYNPPPLALPNIHTPEATQDFWQRMESQQDMQQRYYDQYRQDQQVRRRLDKLEWDSWQRQQNDKDKR